MQAYFFSDAASESLVRRISGPLRLMLLVVLALGSVSLLSACASVPSQEMSDARRALDAAVHADAQRLLPNALGRASANLESATSALRAGQYDEARVLARAARDEAIDVRMLATRLVQVREAIAKARDEGRVWQDTDQLIQRALAMSRAGDTSGALLVVEQAVISLRQ